MNVFRSEKSGKQSTPNGSQSQKLQILAYALPRPQNDPRMQQVIEYDSLSLHDEPLGAGVSFLDFDGIVTMAGVYETIHNTPFLRQMGCIAKADLDLRQRELFSLSKDQKIIIFLVSNVPRFLDNYPIEPNTDLFRRIVDSCGIDWGSRNTPYPAVQSIVPEFREYVTRYGTGYTIFHINKKEDRIKPICSGDDQIYGLSVSGGRLFFLPCVIPQTHEQIIEVATSAIQAVISYRRRMSQEMPDWTADFSFGREADLRTQATDFRKQVEQIVGQIDSYISFKGALCFQSDPLVEVIRRLLDHFSDVALTIDDKCIEDASIRDEQGQIRAVVGD